MATYTVTNKYLIDNFAVLQLLTPSEIAVGSSIVVAGVDATFNGTFTVRALPQYLFLGIDTQGDLLYDYQVPIADQVLYAKTADDVSRVAASGTVANNPVCTWVTAGQVFTYLGIGVMANPSDDYTLLTQSVDAGNQFCYRRRQESGYIDSLTTSPGGDVTLATLMYCASLWRSRGSIETTYATFDGMGSAPQQSLTPIVKQLLGIPRPAVA
jgi:hypothetical protein